MFEEPCPQLYFGAYEYMVGARFVSGHAGQTPIALCEAAAALGATAAKSVACSTALAAFSEAMAENQVRGPVLPEAMAAAKTARAYVYTVNADPKTETYVGAARFIHLPRDVLIARARSVDGQPRVVSFVWAPSE